MGPGGPSNLSLMGMDLVDRVEVVQEVREGKKPPKVLIDSLGGEGDSVTQLLKAVKNGLAVKPQMARTADVLSPKEGLPSGKQFRTGSGLNNAR